jgi:hypothetical protein
MNSLKNIVKEEGIVKIIYQYKTELEWYQIIKDNLFNFKNMIKNEIITEEMVEYFIPLIQNQETFFFYDLCNSNIILSDDFIRTHCENLNIQQLLYKQSIPEDILIKNINDIEWWITSKNHLQENIIDKIYSQYGDRINLYYLHTINNKSNDFITKYYHMMEFDYLFIKDTILPEKIQHFIHLLNENQLKMLFETQIVPLNLTEQYSDIFNKITHFSFKCKNKSIVDNQLEMNNIDYSIVYNTLTEIELEENIENINFTYICQYQKLSLPFIEKYIDRLNKTMIITYQDVPESFIEEHLDSVDWSSLIAIKKLSNSFLEKHLDNIDITELTIYQNLDEEFIINNLDLMEIDEILRFQYVSEDFVKTYSTPRNIISCFENNKIELSSEFIEEKLLECNFTDIVYFSDNFINNVPNSFFYENLHLNQLYLESNGDNPIDEEFLDKNLNNLMLDVLFRNHKFSINVLGKYIKCMYQDPSIWKIISQYQILTEDFICKYYNNLDINIILKYQNVSDDFKENIKNHFENLYFNLDD